MVEFSRPGYELRVTRYELQVEDPVFKRGYAFFNEQVYPVRCFFFSISSGHQSTIINREGVEMKRIILLFFCFSLFFSLQSRIVWAQDIKIGVLNMQKLQQNSVRFQKIREVLKKKFNAFQKKLDGERAQIAKIEEELRKQSMMLSLDAKEDKEMDLGKRTRHYKYMYGEVTQEMKDAEFEATRRVGKEIEKIVEKMSQKEKFTIILEDGTVGLIYYDDTIDITNQVTEAYDKLGK